MRPIVALLSDFGAQDHYVGAMKGAVLSVCPEAQLVDVVHELAPRDLQGASFALMAAVDAFPVGTVFLAVVDPGVGTARRALAVQTSAHFFVAPDNGLLTLVLDDHPEARAHAITNRGLFRHHVSSTFHGRDVFGPVAGHLARGLPIEDVGEAVADPIRLPIPAVKRLGPQEWEGEIVHIDRFGNLTTNISDRQLSEILSHFAGDPTEVVVVVEGSVVPLVSTYGDVPEGEPCALVGSSRRVEVAISGANAARILGAARGASVRIRPALSRTAPPGRL